MRGAIGRIGRRRAREPGATAWRGAAGADRGSRANRAGAHGGDRYRGRAARHRLPGGAQRSGGGGDRGRERRARADRKRGCAERRGRLHRSRLRRRGASGGDHDFPRRKAGSVDRAREDPCGHGGDDRDRDPARLSGRGDDRPDRTISVRRAAAQGAVFDKVHQWPRADRRWLARADRRAVDGRGGSDARRCGVRDGVRTRVPAADPRDGGAARADDQRPARRRRRRVDG